MNDFNELIPTRVSLLNRLKDWSDEDSWKTFFDTYWRLIYNAATKAGLNDAEAQDVVQETVIAVLKSMPTFEYKGTHGSFKSWLLRLTSWRIMDQLRKRQRAKPLLKRLVAEYPRTATVERVPDPASLDLETTWNEEWEKNLMDVVVDRVKGQVDPKHFQIFELYAYRGWPVTKVARTLGVNAGTVYMAKHRISGLIRKEMKRLEIEPI